jgi:hypothetical protein
MITSSTTRRWRIRRNHGSGKRAALLGAVAALSGAGIAVTLAAGPAGAQTAAAPPQPGATLSVTGLSTSFFFTGTDRQAYLSDMSSSMREPLGGQLIGGPAAVMLPAGDASPFGACAVFGRGTNNQLWWNQVRGDGPSRWERLGGVLTSKPNAVVGPGGNTVRVFARGADGAVWYRAGHATSDHRVVWDSWASMGGRLLPGTAPVAVWDGGYVAAVGIDHAVWVSYASPDGRRSWHSIGGSTTSDPGLATPATGAVVAFARGTTANAAWYNEFRGHSAGVTAGWHTLGGRLTSGLTAITVQRGSRFGETVVMALGPHSKVMIDTGTWPELSGWTLVPIG